MIGRTLAALLLALPPWCAAAEPGYLARDDVRAFIAEMADKHGFVRPELDLLFSKLRRQQSVIRAMTPPPDSVRSWQAYRAQFVNPARIDAGVRFREANAGALARAAEAYGVPAEIILGIIGVETAYGRNTGAVRIADALATLAFDFPSRAEYFRSELEQYLLFARDERIDVLSLRGSAAGAMGIPQFMPGTYRRYAVDFDGDGRRDLIGSAADAIGSVANFLKEHGWRRGEPVAMRTQVIGGAYKALTAAIKPALRPAELTASGISVPEDASPDTLFAVLELQTPGQPPEVWLGRENFYVITRYNRSTFYALAVLELARAVDAAGR